MNSEQSGSHFILQKKSKDIDLLIRGLHLDEIEAILKPHGFVKEVGKAFGILKFVPTGWTEEIDIAIPRIEKKIGTTRQAFEIVSDPFLPLEEDLKRRDFTINSIAISLDGKIIDPFGGIKDIELKTIRATSPSAFIEDGLRIVRAIQFGSRFDFEIEKETLDLILKHIGTLDEISGERITDELDKIFLKGDIIKGFELLKQTTVLKQLVGKDIDFTLEEVKRLTRFDFFHLILQSSDKPEQLFKTRLKGDLETFKGMKAISRFKEKFSTELTKVERRFLLSELISICPQVIDSSLIEGLDSERQEFISKTFPFRLSDLAVDGDILIEKGFKEGREIGEKLKLLFSEVLQEKRKNTLDDLLK